MTARAGSGQAMWLLPIAVLIAGILGGCAPMLSVVTPDEGIKEDPTDRTMGKFIDDEVLENFATVNLRKASEGLAESHLSVTSINGAVLLTGQVRAEALRQQAEEVVLGLKNVRRVYNEIEVAGPTSFLTRSSDTWITGKVKSLLMASDAIPGSEIKVVTENGVVYLMGLVTRDDADAAAERTRNIGGVRKVVRIFEYVD